MNWRSPIVLILVLAFVAIGIVLFLFIETPNDKPQEEKKPVNWKEHYDAGSRSPYGLFLFREMLVRYYEDLGKKTHRVESLESAEEGSYIRENRSVYFMIDKNLNDISSGTRSFLLDYVASGNCVFLSGEQLPTFAQYLLWKHYKMYNYYLKEAKFHFTGKHQDPGTIYSFPLLTDGKVSLQKIPLLEKDSLHYKGRLDSMAAELDIRKTIQQSMKEDTITELEEEDISFETDETIRLTEFDPRLVGTAHELIQFSSMEGYNFVRVDYGSGSFFIHLFPFAFTNYSLLQEKNVELLEKTLNCIPPSDLLYIEGSFNPSNPFTINPGGKGQENENRTSPLQFILSTTSLRWAYFITLVTFLLFIVFRIKRRQRPIPAPVQVRNSSLSFAETLSDLYFQQGKHHYLVRQKHKLVLTFIREKYYLSSRNSDDAFIATLSTRSGIGREKLTELFRALETGENNPTLSDEEFIRIHQLTEYFYKNCN